MQCDRNIMDDANKLKNLLRLGNLDNVLQYDLEAKRLSSKFYNGQTVISMPAMKDWVDIAVKNLEKNTKLNPVMLLAKTVMYSNVGTTGLQDAPYSPRGSSVLGNILFWDENKSQFVYNPKQWALVITRSCYIAAAEESVYQFIYKLAHQDLARQFALQHCQR